MKIPKPWSEWTWCNNCGIDNNCMWWLKLNHRHPNMTKFDKQSSVSPWLPRSWGPHFRRWLTTSRKLEPGWRTQLCLLFFIYDTTLSDPQKSLPLVLTLKVIIPRSLHDKMTMSKHIIVEQVCVIFDGVRVRYHDKVTKVIFHDVNEQYMYHVVYNCTLMVTQKIIDVMN